MKKKRILICMLLLMNCFCISCGVRPESGDENSLGLSEAENEAGNINLRMIVPRGGLINNPLAVSQTGCYEIMLNNDWSANILYTDVETKQRIYLSSDLSAERHSEADTSWLENVEGGAAPFVADGHLYILCNGTKEQAGKLYQSDLDGSNRKVLIEFTEYAPISDSVVTDSKFLYTMMSDYQNIYIVRIDPQSGAIERLQQLEDDVVWIMTAYDDNLVFKTIAVDETAGNTKDTVQMYQNQVHQVYKYSVSDGSLTQVYQWKQDTASETFDGQYMYVFDFEKEQLIEFDLETETKKNLASFAQLGINDRKITEVKRVWDNHLIFMLNDGLMQTMDLSDLKMQPLAPLSDGYTFLFIVGEFGDQFLVTSGTIEIPMESTAPDGTPIIINTGTSQLSLSDKSAFWNSEYDFEEIENVFLQK